MDNAAPVTGPSIERTPEGLTVTMKVPRMGCISAFLGAWLCAWAVGEISGLSALFERLPHADIELLFTVVWLLGWSAAGGAAAAFLALTLNGREIVMLAPDGLRRRIEAFGIGYTWRYEPALVSDLRVMPPSRGSGAFFGFEYGQRRVRFGSGLTAQDAARIVDALLEAGAQPGGGAPPAEPQGTTP
jgi:hypothetical protein